MSVCHDMPRQIMLRWRNSLVQRHALSPLAPTPPPTMFKQCVAPIWRPDQHGPTPILKPDKTPAGDAAVSAGLTPQQMLACLALDKPKRWPRTRLVHRARGDLRAHGQPPGRPRPGPGHVDIPWTFPRTCRCLHARRAARDIFTTRYR